MSQDKASVTVWLGSQCPLCTKEIALMRRLDWRNRVAFVDIYTSEKCPIDPARLLERFHAQEEGEPLVNGCSVVAPFTVAAANRCDGEITNGSKTAGARKYSFPSN